MKTANRMRDIIKALATKHGASLDEPGDGFKLEMPGYQPLSVEKVGPASVAVAHTFIQEGDVMWDPEIVFLEMSGEWIPTEITQSPAGVYRRLAELDAAGRTIERVSLRGIAEVATFANMWARNLQAQGWTERATRTR